MTKNTPFKEIIQALKASRHILVASHIRPDGDALGSTIAVALWLQQMGKAVTAWNQDGVSEKYQYLPNHQLLGLPSLCPGKFDAIVALDTATRERLGTVIPCCEGCGLWVNIDHHITNPRYGDLNYIDAEAPATGQIVYELLREADADITKEIATNLFVAISTDTGSFQYPSTTAKTFDVAAQLMHRGVDVGRLSQSMYENYPLRRLDLMRELLNNAQFFCGGRAAAFSLSDATAQRLGLVPEDNEGLMDCLRGVESVKATAFFEELPGEGHIRISLRSKSEAIANVCEICMEFGGGGHPLAAGARVKGSLQEVEQKVMEALSKRIRRND